MEGESEEKTVRRRAPACGSWWRASISSGQCRAKPSPTSLSREEREERKKRFFLLLPIRIQLGCRLSYWVATSDQNYPGLSSGGKTDSFNS